MALYSYPVFVVGFVVLSVAIALPSHNHLDVDSFLTNEDIAAFNKYENAYSNGNGLRNAHKHDLNLLTRYSDPHATGKRRFFYVGSAKLLKRTPPNTPAMISDAIDTLENPVKRELDQLGGANFVRRELDQLGGANFVRRELDQLGGANFVKRELDQLGGANFVKRELDQLGGVNFVKRELDQLGGANFVKRELDQLGGANFVKRELDQLGGANFVKRYLKSVVEGGDGLENGEAGTVVARIADLNVALVHNLLNALGKRKIEKRELHTEVV